ncbi:UDP-N-acetylmuramoyl-L-alanyl-D-glutamate--2,6-diaminopimelate ligase [Vagococcus entomophilus]|uniref:UDP-N-acetylmuramoyl-L-alanyl-D-glutamate--2,6-diaminopimelate ligase n=1 Tax=Vagococcus entomophilus TaxID=1160095 RepID=A0A430AI86_9ENTE|nr:UDP-N-acetylmuramoyl-L-alanyl-D-glutamate--2,6-diaminopimelate ligase [Vagococcus entomophilus]RSU07829.1 UDP-N-acetylmuramoyl-L-alanyl-D-glutamate--2,6-diaminopimelate ligase [Vagococcus entomophilus]
MNGLQIKKAIHPLKVQNITSYESLEIQQVTQDTRTIQKGSCFICIEGATIDGHDLVSKAIEQGASLIIAEKKITAAIPVMYVYDTKKALAQLSVLFYDNPSKKMKMVGVTGTNGKTTTTHMIEAVLEKAGHQTGIIGTMYNKIGTEKIPTINTTPDALTTQKLLKKMSEQQIDSCAMEVSSHALVQGRAWGIDFDVAVFTNLSQDHLEYHHTMTDYFYAKSLLFSQLGNSYECKDYPKTAIINCDDHYGRKLEQLTAANVLTFGVSEEAVIQAKNIHISSEGTRFDLDFMEKTYPVKIKMIGMFNIYNALASFGACYALGIKPNKVISALEELPGVKGRFELVPNQADITVIVDYAHTPDGLENVLQTVKEFAKKDIYCVVGCGGDRDPSKRPIMAKIATDIATKIIFTSDNPRTEDPEVILDQMTSGLDSRAYIRVTDRKSAIERSLSEATPGDVVLIAGKGHENYQIIGKTKHHFDDVEVVMSYFENKNRRL